MKRRTSSLMSSSSHGSDTAKKGSRLKSRNGHKRNGISKAERSSLGSYDLPTDPIDPILNGGGPDPSDHSDAMNYAILVALYTLQGIPMGLSASIPFLIQQKVKSMAASAAASAAASGASAVIGGADHGSVAKMAYNAQAVFALCSWPFSLKLLWAPLVDSIYWRRMGRRKSWLIPVQLLAGAVMVMGSDYVETNLGLSTKISSLESAAASSTFDVKGVTSFFFLLYFLMATQDIAVDGWALTMLSKKNRGKGPVCNSIGQNIGYFLSFVGFLALNDAESSEKLWRPLLGLKSKPDQGLVSLGGFIRFMGYFMLLITTLVAIFKHEDFSGPNYKEVNSKPDQINKLINDEDEPQELDASEIGLYETYRRLWAVCSLPSVKWLFLILLTYRLPTALSDNVKFLKAVEFGLSKQTTALLSPAIVLPLGIAVPLIASKIWHNHPLKQFITAYKIRISLVAILDVAMLLIIRDMRHGDIHATNTGAMKTMFWVTIIGSTAMQATVSSLQFNAQMTFFASRVDPAIGGTYMTLLNTAANLGGTWPSSFVMFLIGQWTVAPTCTLVDGVESCTGGRDPYFSMQAVFSILGCLWLFLLGGKVMHVANLPEEAWRTGLDSTIETESMRGLSIMEGGIAPPLKKNKEVSKADKKKAR